MKQSGSNTLKDRRKDGQMAKATNLNWPKEKQPARQGTRKTGKGRQCRTRLFKNKPRRQEKK